MGTQLELLAIIRGESAHMMNIRDAAQKVVNVAQAVNGIIGSRKIDHDKLTASLGDLQNARTGVVDAINKFADWERTAK